MVTANTNKELMRETVIVGYADGETGVKNAVFDINIPEEYAIELHTVDFLLSYGAGGVGTRVKFYLVDDPDEVADPGHAAEKVIQSTEWRNEFTTEGRAMMFSTIQLDCHRTLLVQNPNFIASNDVDPDAVLNTYARIWFALVKISPRQILDLLRQQQY